MYQALASGLMINLAKCAVERGGSLINLAMLSVTVVP
jgi:hypothetical protein